MQLVDCRKRNILDISIIVRFAFAILNSGISFIKNEIQLPVKALLNLQLRSQYVGRGVHYFNTS
jgi:hypothetical protein